MAPNEIQRFGENSYVWLEDYTRNISVNFCQNIYSEIAIKLNFHFFHRKSMKI